MTDELERISGYLSSGGLFNPELANHEAVRELLIDCRNRIAELEAALKPFANVTPVLQEDDHGVIYEWALNCDDIRAARKVLGDKE